MMTNELWGPIFLEDHLSLLIAPLEKGATSSYKPIYTLGFLVVKRAMSTSLHHLSLIYAHFSSASLSLRGQANALVSSYHCCSNWRTASNLAELCPPNLCIGVKVLIAFCGNYGVNWSEGRVFRCQPEQPIRAHGKGNC